MPARPLQEFFAHYPGLTKFIGNVMMAFHKPF